MIIVILPIITLIAVAAAVAVIVYLAIYAHQPNNWIERTI